MDREVARERERESGERERSKINFIVISKKRNHI